MRPDVWAAIFMAMPLAVATSCWRDPGGKYASPLNEKSGSCEPLSLSPVLPVAVCAVLFYRLIGLA
jgi:hypothetical protein